jgi:hypothetical protein
VSENPQENRRLKRGNCDEFVRGLQVARVFAQQWVGLLTHHLNRVTNAGESQPKLISAAGTKLAESKVRESLVTCHVHS